MTPAHVSMRVATAKAVSAGLRDAAGYCRSDQDALRARLVQSAQTIDELVVLLEQATFVAKLNHDTITARAEA